MRYQKIFVQIWNDEKFIKLSEPSKVFFLYLLTSPHSNLIGAFVLKRGYVAEDLIWSIQKVDKAIKELEKSGLLVFDKTVSVIVICNYLKYNPLQNPNQYTGAMDIFRTLPKTETLLNIFNTLETLSKRFNKPFETALKPDTDTDTDTDTEADTGTEKEEEPLKEYSLYGEFNNVKLTDENYEKLSKKYNGKLAGIIETMSQHLDTKKSDPYHGKDHYSAILKNDHWLNKEKGGKGEQSKFNNLKEQDYHDGAF
jgi:hypothetical protein